MTTAFLEVKNWAEFQHYGKRNPPWIKLHRAILDDYNFCALSDASKGHLLLIWLLASQNNGKVPHDVAFLERKLSISSLNLPALIEGGFLIGLSAASNVLAKG